MIPFILGAELTAQEQQIEEAVHLTQDIIIQAETLQAISWMPDGQGLAYLSNEVMIVTLLPNFQGRMLPDIGVKTSLAWNPDGKQLAVLGDLSSIWNAEGQVYSRIVFPSGAHLLGSDVIEWNVSGDKVLLFGRETEDQRVKLRVFDLQSGTVINVGDDVQTLTHTAIWHNTDDRILRWDGNEFEIWDVYDNHAEQIQAFEIPKLRVDAVTWSSDNQFIVASGQDPNGINLIIWDIASEAIIFQVDGISDTVTAIDWHPEHDMLATGHVDGTVQLWSINEGIHNIATYACSQNSKIPYINVIAWSPDGSKLTCGSADGTLTIWSLR
jgi:WD40 repeat protein